MSIKVFSVEYLDDLTHQAAGAPRRRQHRNIHTDYTDPCQRLFNAIEPDSYNPSCCSIRLVRSRSTALELNTQSTKSISCAD
jgi:hypothetical protein